MFALYGVNQKQKEKTNLEHGACEKYFFNVSMKNNDDLFSLGHNAMSEDADKCKCLKYIDQQMRNTEGSHVQI